MTPEALRQFADIIGFLAGGICTGSVLPQIARLIRYPAEAAKQSILRNAGLALGNALWVVFGVITDTLPVVGMCGLAAVLNGTVAVQVTRARLREQHALP
jgi:uncharacterized protein with PQ loop repeat